MFGITFRRSLATLAVMVGLLAAAGPAGAAISDTGRSSGFGLGSNDALMLHTGGGWDPGLSRASADGPAPR